MRRGDLRLLFPDLGFLLGFLLLATAACDVFASIHEYSNEPFVPRSNSFFFHGGREGLYASEVNLSSPNSDGKSFIRFESVTFRRTKESASRRHDMQQNTGLMEAILVEIQDRDKIGGTYFNSDAICCTPDLQEEISCKVGAVIIRRNPDNPDWPKRFQTFFDGTNEEATMVTQTVFINSTGMYYLYFMFCDPQLEGTVITGRTVWRNPQGYLPGKMAPLMRVMDAQNAVPVHASSGTNASDQPEPSSPTSTDGGWGELENGLLHEDHDGDKEGWDDIDPVEEQKPPPLASIQAAQNRPVVQPKPAASSMRPKTTLKPSKAEDDDLWGAIAAPAPRTASRSLHVKPASSQDDDDLWGSIAAPPPKTTAKSLNLKTTMASDDSDPWAAIAAPPPSTKAKPLSLGRGRGAKPAPAKLGAQRIDRTSSSGL